MTCRMLVLFFYWSSWTCVVLWHARRQSFLIWEFTRLQTWYGQAEACGTGDRAQNNTKIKWKQSFLLLSVEGWLEGKNGQRYRLEYVLFCLNHPRRHPPHLLLPHHHLPLLHPHLLPHRCPPSPLPHRPHLPLPHHPCQGPGNTAMGLARCHP